MTRIATTFPRYRRWTLLRVAACFAVLMAVNIAAPPAALGKPKTVTVAITAVVEIVYDPRGSVCASVAEGDTVTGSYTYTLKAPDTNDFPMVGDYQYNSPPNGITLNIGGATTGTDPASTNFLVELVNDYNGSDNIVLRSYDNLPLSCGTPVDHISWQLDDPTMTALSNTDLLKGPPDLAAFQSFSGLDIRFQGSSFALVRARVTDAVKVKK